MTLDVSTFKFSSSQNNKETFKISQKYHDIIDT